MRPSAASCSLTAPRRRFRARLEGARLGRLRSSSDRSGDEPPSGLRGGRLRSAVAGRARQQSGGGTGLRKGASLPPLAFGRMSGAPSLRSAVRA